MELTGSRRGAKPAEGKPAEIDIAVIRDGVRTVLAGTLAKAVAAQEPAWTLVGAEVDVAAAAQALERAINTSATRGARATSRTPHRRLYTDTVRLVNQALGAQVGPYPDDVAGLLYLAGRREAEAVVAESAQAAAEPDPRETIRRLFVRTLMRAAPAFARERERALEAARAIEVSCFNAAVRASKESEEPPRRQWCSPAFVDIYSTRCGTITALLDPASTASRAYPAAPLAERLLLSCFGETLGGPGEGLSPLRPDDLGDLTEKELCPQATAAERAEIAKRSVQKIVEKESNLFRCPHCTERRCTYQEVQRRSLDEAPDYFCRCLNPKCGRRFTGRS
jgi:DNA-directed RNA polymerase subunit M/transcription elongation factor TFIIS